MYLFSYFFYYMIGPLQLLIALTLLYGQMKLSIIPGVILLLIMIPINLYLQRIQKQLTVCRNEFNKFSFFILIKLV